MTDFGVAVPEQFPTGRPADSTELRAGLIEAERAGLHSAWVMEGLIGPKPQLEPVTLLAYAAAVTSRLGLGLGVTILPLRSPVILAKSLATLDQLSGGRVIAGVGVGGDHTDYGAFGTTQSKRVPRFTSGLDAMRALWRDETVHAEGPGWSLEGVRLEVTPVQDPLPVWVGARAETAVRRAAGVGDGFLGAGSCTTAEFAHQITIVNEELERTGRDPASFPIAKRVYAAVDENRERARDLLGDWFAHLYGDRDRADGSVAAGSVAECVGLVREVAEAGAGLIVLNPVADEVAQIRRFVNEVIPAYRESG